MAVSEGLTKVNKYLLICYQVDGAQVYESRMHNWSGDKGEWYMFL